MEVYRKIAKVGFTFMTATYLATDLTILENHAILFGLRNAMSHANLSFANHPFPPWNPKRKTKKRIVGSCISAHWVYWKQIKKGSQNRILNIVGAACVKIYFPCQQSKPVEIILTVFINIHGLASVRIKKWCFPW